MNIFPYKNVEDRRAYMRVYAKKQRELFKKLKNQETNISQENALKAFKKWLAGKLVAGNEKATPHNDVILKLLAELKDGESKV